MSEQYSIDDILQEIEQKKSKPSSTTPDTTLTDLLYGDEPPSVRTRSLSATQVLSEVRREKSESDYIGVTEILSLDTPEKKPAHRAAKQGSAPVKPAPLELKPESKEEVKVEHKPEESKKPVQPLNTEQIRKKTLQRDLELEDSEDLIASVNPYELKGPEKKKEDIVTIPTRWMEGDTQSVSGNELKKLSPATPSPINGKKPIVIKPPKDQGRILKTQETEAVREYIPGDKGQAASDKKQRLSNSALIESLNQALEKKRISDIRAQRTLTLSEGLEGIDKLPTNGLNIDYSKQIIKETGPVPLTDPVLVEEKLKELSAKRKRKIRDFVLEDIEDPVEETVEEETDEYDGYDSTGEIKRDLDESHRGLKIRFGMLFILTFFMGLITFLNDFVFTSGTVAGKQITFLGLNLSFIGQSYSAEKFIYLNLAFGVLGLVICSSVIVNGFTKLFTGRGDCDSVCAVSYTVSLIATALQLGNTSYLQLNYTYVYIAAGLVGLLFNTLGKLQMVVRAKRNFKLVSGDSTKYFVETVKDESAASMLTKGAVSEKPSLAVMRKTEFLTDFLKTSYCIDKADTISKYLAPASVLFALLLGVLVYFIPNNQSALTNNLYRAVSVATAAVFTLSPLVMLFLVNNPLLRASKELSRKRAAVLGYASLEEFTDTNSVLVDANLLFPAGSVAFRSFKQCRDSSSHINILIDEAMILAASLAIKSKSILSYMFYDIIGGKEELLKNVDNCIYEDNKGIMGWIGARRVMLGNIQQLKSHGIKPPESTVKKDKKKVKSDDMLFLSVGGEVVAIFYIDIFANQEIKDGLQALANNGISIIIKSTDALLTVANIADLFDIPPQSVRILPQNLHELFHKVTKYASKGSGAVCCDGTFTSFSKAVNAAKSLTVEITRSTLGLYAALGLGALVSALVSTLGSPDLLRPSYIILYQLIVTFGILAFQRFKKY